MDEGAEFEGSGGELQNWSTGRKEGANALYAADSRAIVNTRSGTNRRGDLLRVCVGTDCRLDIVLAGSGHITIMHLAYRNE
jgi:hypothetical protein